VVVAVAPVLVMGIAATNRVELVVDRGVDLTAAPWSPMVEIGV